MPPPFENRYKKGQVKTVKDCWTCRKSTFVCMMTANYATTGDFFYTCETHLKDRNFASALPEPAPAKPVSPSPSVSQSEIDQAIQEYQERQKAKDKPSKEEDKKDDDKEGTVKKASDKDKSEGPKSPTAAAAVTPPEPLYYELHRNFYDMRLRLNHQKTMAKDAQTRRSQLELPPTPTSRPSSRTA